jgi:osmotically-inducible protein OsmY
MSIARNLGLVALIVAAATSVSAHAMSHRVAEDAGIASSVEAALDASSVSDVTSSIQVQSIDHVIYLHGLVDSYPEKVLVQSIAAQTPGVLRVVNSLELHNE